MSTKILSSLSNFPEPWVTGRRRTALGRGQHGEEIVSKKLTWTNNKIVLWSRNGALKMECHGLSGTETITL